jgi:hypothetical protein
MNVDIGFLLLQHFAVPQGGNSMAACSARETFQVWIVMQTFLRDKPPNLYYLPKPKTDEERTAIIEMVEQEEKYGNTVILLETVEFERAMLKNLDPILESINEELRNTRLRFDSE